MNSSLRGTPIVAQAVASTRETKTSNRGQWLSWTNMADAGLSALPVIVRGEGPYLEDASGSRLLDAVGGLFTAQIGYSYGEELGAAAAAQLRQLGFYPNWTATNPTTLSLADRMLDLVPPHLTRVFFTSGGSEAVESGWKLIRQAFVARGEPARYKVIGRRAAYHGCSVGALSLSDVPEARAPFEPLLLPLRHGENTDPANWPGASPEERLTRAIETLEAAVLAEGPETVAAIIVEPVQHSGGCLVPPHGYGTALRELCDHYGIVLWCDEIITAFGRLGTWLGSERIGFRPDVVTFAKGLTSGFAPLGGVLFTSVIADAYVEANATFQHGYTFGGHPLACAIALKNLEIMERVKVLENVRTREPHLDAALHDIVASSPIAVEARGAGFFRAIELTRPDLVAPARDAIRRHGVIVRSIKVSSCLAVAPPLICDDEHIEEIAKGIAAGLAEVAD